jgi:hypothetical protein
MMRGVVVVVCLSGAGCFSKPPPPNDRLDGGGDGSISIDAPEDAGRCGSWGTFGTATRVGGLLLPSIIEPTISSDRDVIYRDGNSALKEATRMSPAEDFGSSGLVNGLVGANLTAAWLSPNRLDLYFTNGAQLFGSTRSSTSGPFAVGAAGAQDVQDVTLTSDESIAVWATTSGQLVYGAPLGGLVSALLTVDDVNLTSPSIGDHDRSLVWVESAPATNSMMYIADLTFPTPDQAHLGQPNPIDLGGNTFHAGTILTDDGSTLYFTTSTTSTGPPLLYVSHRVCN